MHQVRLQAWNKGSRRLSEAVGNQNDANQRGEAGAGTRRVHGHGDDALSNTSVFSGLHRAAANGYHGAATDVDPGRQHHDGNAAILMEKPSALTLICNVLAAAMLIPLAWWLREQELFGFGDWVVSLFH